MNFILLAASDHGISEVSPSITYIFTGLLAVMVLCLALEEKIHAKKSVIVGVTAIVALLLGAFTGILPFGEVHLPNGHKMNLPVFIPGIEWGVVTIILGSSLFVDVTSKSGLFTFIAIKFTKMSKGDPRRLLWFYGIMTVVFSAVLNNVTAMIIVGSLSAVSLGKLEQRDKLLGFLLVEGLLTNIGGLLTLISSVPNIIVGTTANIGFVTFFIKAAPYVVVATAATILMGSRAFGIKSLRTDEERTVALRQVSSFDERDGIESMGFFWFGAAMLLLFICFIASASFNGWPIGKLGMGFVAMMFAVVMLCKFKSSVGKFYSGIDWDLLFFFVYLFVAIYAMEQAKVLELIGKGIAPIIGMGANLGGGLLLVSSAFASSVTDNIPLAAVLSNILNSMNIAGDSGMWWSVIFGANLGGNLTPIGSASTLVAVTIMHKHDLKISFMGFVRKALPFAILHIFLATLYVLFILKHLPG
ncbi:MAG: SLC13 family permease [Verrucomicrobiota bacterium]|jgi:Na+/H+ antiporter NhaD/arsenite permease-like protein|nr:SLC13 family permease [Verrucomicrobiota bacterium]